MNLVEIGRCNSYNKSGVPAAAATPALLSGANALNDDDVCWNITGPLPCWVDELLLLLLVENDCTPP